MASIPTNELNNLFTTYNTKVAIDGMEGGDSKGEQQVAEPRAGPQVQPWAGPQAGLRAGPQAGSQAGPRAGLQAGLRAGLQAGFPS